MYLSVIWENVNSIMASCTWLFIQNTWSNLCVLIYTDVFRIQLDSKLRSGGNGRRLLSDHGLIGLAQRVIADRAAEPNKGRPVTALARLGQPRDADLLRLGEFLRCQHFHRAGKAGGGGGLGGLRGHD